MLSKVFASRTAHKTYPLFLGRSALLSSTYASPRVDPKWQCSCQPSQTHLLVSSILMLKIVERNSLTSEMVLLAKPRVAAWGPLRLQVLIVDRDESWGV